MSYFTAFTFITSFALLDNSLKNAKFGVVTTMANEESTIERYIADVLSHTTDFETTLYLVFDRVCKDSSLQIAQSLAINDTRIKVIYDENAVCPRDAYVTGFGLALEEQNDLILDINGGFRHLPSDIPSFINSMDVGIDCVMGTRFGSGGQSSFQHFQRYFLSVYGTKLANFALGLNISDLTSGFHLFRAHCLQSLLDQGIKSKYHFMQTEMRYFVAKRFNFCAVPISYKSNSSPLRLRVVTEALFELLKLAIYRPR